MDLVVDFRTFYELTYGTMSKDLDRIDVGKEKAYFSSRVGTQVEVERLRTWDQELFQRFHAPVSVLVGSDNKGKVWHDVYVKQGDDAYVLSASFYPSLGKIRFRYLVRNDYMLDYLVKERLELCENWILPMTNYMLESMVSEHPKIRLPFVTGTLSVITPYS